MKLLAIVSLVLPFLVGSTLNAAAKFSHSIDSRLAFPTSEPISAVAGSPFPSLNFTLFKGTQQINVSNQSTRRSLATDYFGEDNHKIVNWQEKVMAFFNTSTKALRIHALSNPILLQEKRLSSYSASKPPTRHRWYITTGHFKTKANAIALVNRLKRLGFSVLIQPFKKGASVLIGPYDYRFHATMGMKELKDIAHVQGALINFAQEHRFS